MDEIIQSATDLSVSIEKEAQKVLNIYFDMGCVLEKISWDIYQLVSNLKAIKDELGK